ncbi:MAG: hypothetical protein WA152_02625 [Microgenomates group bacterium]
MEKITGLEFDLRNVSHDLKETIALGIKTTISLVETFSRNNRLIQSPQLLKLMKEKQKGWTTYQWSGDGVSNITVDSLEKAIKLPPNMRLAGFELYGEKWPIRPDEDLSKLKDVSLLYLSEEEVKRLYVACGGELNKSRRSLQSGLTG